MYYRPEFWAAVLLVFTLGCAVNEVHMLHLFPSRSRLILWIASFIIVWVIVFWIASPNGVFSNTVRVRDFALCKAEDVQDETPRLLKTTVISPTEVIYACGHFEIERAYPGKTCLGFRLFRDKKEIFRPDDLCLQAHSQHFSQAIRTEELLVTGRYRLEVYHVPSRLWSESVAFDVR